jgi:hypothetical protein
LLKVPLFIPEPVEIELEALWLREFETKRSAFTDLQRHTDSVSVDLKVALPSAVRLLQDGRGLKDSAGHHNDPYDDASRARVRRDGSTPAAAVHRPRQGLPRRGDLLVNR